MASSLPRDDDRSMRERMLAGDLYIADDPELAERNLRAMDLMEAFNATPARAGSERRRLLEELVAETQPSLFVTPLTDDRELATLWLERFQGRGVDGVVAKDPAQPYRPGVRAMVKVKRERTADCVVAGFRWQLETPLPSSLMLGLYDGDGSLHHVGVTSSFTQRQRERLLEEVAPLAAPLDGHPWERGFLVSGGAMGRLKGAAGRWTPEMERDWVPLAPTLVCEVAYDQVDRNRFRHPARFVRWRPDRDARSCTLDQLHAHAAP
jgi:ATP-dependent DNA ligase